MCIIAVCFAVIVQHVSKNCSQFDQILKTNDKMNWLMER